jgi:type VI secretion system secreted protein VgrG
MQAQATFISGIDPQDQGKHPDSVNGQPAQKAAAGSRTPDPAQPVERFATPIVLMESPSTINWASPASTLIFAGEHLQWTTQNDMHWAAADTVSGVSGYGASLYSHDGGIQAIAANGPVSLQAHTDMLEILADQSVSVKSVNDSIDIKANQKIVLQAGQSSVTLEGGNITFACPGTFSVKGATHAFDGGSEQAATLPDLPNTLTEIKPDFDRHVVLQDDEGYVLADRPYRAQLRNGKIIEGVSDHEGSISFVESDVGDIVHLQVLKKIGHD